MKTKKKQIPLNVLDSISVRFMLDLDQKDFENIERLFFILEEAHWFLIDNYYYSDIALIDFCNDIISHNNIKINLKKALSKFIAYKRTIKVYGAIIFDPSLEYILVVKESFRTKGYSFPKGKKSKDESGIDCAIREVYEEIGLDVTDKIVDICINIYERINLFCVFNVSKDTKFGSAFNEEIAEIKWVKIQDILDNKLDKHYTLIYTGFQRIYPLYKAVKKNQFKFQKSNFERIIEGQRINKAHKL